MKETNSEIRRNLKENHIALWTLAVQIGISEATMIRWMRVEMDEDHRILVEKAIDRIISERGECDE